MNKYLIIFLVGISAILVTLFCSFCVQIYASDPKIRKTNEYRKAVSWMPDVWPETGVYSPGSGLVITRLAFFVFKKGMKSKTDKRFLFYYLFGSAALIVFLSNFIYAAFFNR